MDEIIALGRRKTTPHIQQSETSECALACLAMIASYHGHNTDLVTLRQRYSVSLKGATLNQIMEIAEDIGFSVRPLHGEILDLDHLTLPAILHWDLNHFVVLTRIQRRLKAVNYHINDPAKGPIKLSKSEISRHFTGVSLEFIKSQSFKSQVAPPRLRINQLWSSMSGFWQITRSILTLSIVLQFAALAAPFYLQIAIDTVAPAADKDLLLMLAVGFGGLTLITTVTSWLRSLILVGLNNALSYQIIVNLFRQLLRLPLPWFERRHVGDVISRFGATQPITQLLSEGLIASMLDGVMALLTLGLMCIYSPILAATASVALAIYTGLRIAFLHTIRLKNIDSISASARENSLFIESIRGISAIKAFGQEGNRQRIWQRAKAQSVNANIKLGRLNAGFDAAGQLIMAAERILFVYLAISLALEAKLTIGMVFAFQSYKQHFLESSMRLVGQAMNVSLMKVHLDRLSDIALSRAEDEGRRTSIDKPNPSAGIELRSVRYRYGSGEAEVLRGVDLQVASGEMVALVGPSGGGKTTLLKIMMCIFEPTSGEVLIGGQATSTFKKSAFRRRIGVIAQDDSLFAGSIADNISFFDPDIDISRVMEVAQIALIHDDISSMPLRYDTLVGDMGSSLSGGQRQRVLLARALYGKPDVLFMDEGTANLDPESERRIADALSNLPIMRILVAHRPALVLASDKVFLCESGVVRQVRAKVEERGKQ